MINLDDSSQQPRLLIPTGAASFLLRSLFERWPRSGGTVATLQRHLNRWNECISLKSAVSSPVPSRRNLPQPAAAHIVDKPAHRYLLRNPRMRAQLLQLMSHVFVNILERVKKCRRH